VEGAVDFKIVTSSRAKRARLSVRADGLVVVTRPVGFTDDKVAKFVEQNRAWIATRKRRLADREANADLLATDYEHFLFNRGRARELVKQKLGLWSSVHGFEYRRVTIKQLKSRWGSCSADGSLSFNYKILFLPEEVQDYIVVHELCHLWELNHSLRFWGLVGDLLPGYKEVRRSLKELT